MNTPMESAVPDYADWNKIPWKQLEEYVAKLQQRIYQAERNAKYVISKECFYIPRLTYWFRSKE